MLASIANMISLWPLRIFSSAKSSSTVAGVVGVDCVGIAFSISVNFAGYDQTFTNHGPLNLERDLDFGWEVIQIGADNSACK